MRHFRNKSAGERTRIPFVRSSPPAMKVGLLGGSVFLWLAICGLVQGSDKHENCGFWAERGECATNPTYMSENCAVSCEKAQRAVGEGDGNGGDRHEQCRFWAEDVGECAKNPRWMLENCAASCARVRAKEEEEAAKEAAEDAVDYGESLGVDGKRFDLEVVERRTVEADEHLSCVVEGAGEQTCAWPPPIVRLPDNYPANVTVAPPVPVANAATSLEDLHREGRFTTVEYIRSQQQAAGRLQQGKSVAVKVINFTGMKLKKMWDDGSPEGVYNGIIPGKMGGRTMLMTYDGHTFHFVDDRTGKLYRTITMRHDVFFIVLEPEGMNPKIRNSEAYRAAKREERFMKQYYKAKGYPWLASYGRPKPVLNMWPANYVGQTHTVLTDHTHWLCDEYDNKGSIEKCHPSSPSPPPLEVNLTVVSHAGISGPRVFVIDNLMSEAECDHILRLGKKVVKDSTVGTGSEGFKSDSRTSSTGWLGRYESPILDTMQKRFADVLGLDEARLTSRGIAEELQVVRYEHGQKYNPHHDFADNGGGFGQRFLTLLLYVKLPEGGGHTSFPKAYGERGIRVKPSHRGGAVLFYSMLPDGNGDDLSLHGGDYVASDDEKWVCNLWIWDPDRHS